MPKTCAARHGTEQTRDFSCITSGAVGGIVWTKPLINQSIKGNNTAENKPETGEDMHS